MHGSEHRSKKCRTLRLSTPPLPFSPASGLTLPGAPHTSSYQGWLLVTAFRSPATAASSRRPPSRGHRSRPATSHVLPPGSTARSVSWLHNRLDRRSCLPSRLLRRLRPVAALPERFGKLLRTASAPPTGLLSPPGIDTFNRSGFLPARLMRSPDYPSLPVAASISSFGFGSSFLARYDSTG
jgi:hypothetical protein